MNVVFLGTPDFAVPALEKIAEKHNVVLVVTAPDRKKGRGKKVLPSPVKETALRLNLPVFQPEKINDESSLDTLKNTEAEVFVVAAYGQIIGKKLLALIHEGKGKIVNIHGSLLPEYRGAAPIERAILDGKKEIGVSIMEIEAGLDSGPFAAQRSVNVDDKDALVLRRELAEIGGDLLLEVLTQIEENRARFVPQDHEKATMAPKIEKSDKLLRPEEESAEELDRRVRAMTSYGGAYMVVDGVPLKVFEGRVRDFSAVPGEIYSKQGSLFLGGKKGSLEIIRIQVPGKKQISGEEFLRGHSDYLGKQVDK